MKPLFGAYGNQELWHFCVIEVAVLSQTIQLKIVTVSTHICHSLALRCEKFRKNEDEFVTILPDEFSWLHRSFLGLPIRFCYSGKSSI
jgi:hypothetical protein